MDLEIVGKENLPNVYIDRLRVVTSGDTKILHVDISLYDHAEKKSWFDRIHNLKVKVALVSSQSKRLALINGLDGIYNGDRIDKTIILQPGSGGGFEQTRKGNLIKYTKKEIIQLNGNMLNSLSVFCACYVDGFSFENELLNRYYGPLTGERVFVAGELNEASGHFVYADTGEDYYGPVHAKDGGGFMEGSFHSDKQHRDVVYVQEQNFKLSSDEVLNFDFKLTDSFIPESGPRLSGMDMVSENIRNTFEKEKRVSNISVTPPPDYF